MLVLGIRCCSSKRHYCHCDHPRNLPRDLICSQEKINNKIAQIFSLFANATMHCYTINKVILTVFINLNFNHFCQWKSVTNHMQLQFERKSYLLFVCHLSGKSFQTLVSPPCTQHTPHQQKWLHKKRSCSGFDQKPNLTLSVVKICHFLNWIFQQTQSTFHISKFKSNQFKFELLNCKTCIRHDWHFVVV